MRPVSCWDSASARRRSASARASSICDRYQDAAHASTHHQPTSTHAPPICDRYQDASASGDQQKRRQRPHTIKMRRCLNAAHASTHHQSASERASSVCDRCLAAASPEHTPPVRIRARGIKMRPVSCWDSASARRRSARTDAGRLLAACDRPPAAFRLSARLVRLAARSGIEDTTEARSVSAVRAPCSQHPAPD